MICEYSPISIMKATKNDTEIKNIEQAFIHDSVAMCHILSW